jgi:hypothetical protein
MVVFRYKDEYYLRVVPVKNLFRSNMIHGVVVRGDIFAVRIRDSALTVIPGNSEVVTWPHAGVLLCNSAADKLAAQLQNPQLIG